MKDSEEETMEKLALLKLRGWQFIFYPADICEVVRPGYEAGVDQGSFLGAWNLSNHIRFFFAEEFGDG